MNYLGLTIDLNGEEMALGIIKKVNSRLKFLFRQAQLLDLKTKKLSLALVLCLLDVVRGISTIMVKKALKLPRTRSSDLS